MKLLKNKSAYKPSGLFEGKTKDLGLIAQRLSNPEPRILKWLVASWASFLKSRLQICLIRKQLKHRELKKHGGGSGKPEQLI
ncbi:MAG: hypothetical protein EHM20_01855 [Alphaproteobacteria bacterium]|nr:MAG: hypothetical protein EHM20_01855 [Alphaproteobacteria bacterium]